MSELPLFYCPQLQLGSQELQLDEETRRHVVTVLRIQAGEQIELTNGQGLSAAVTIVLADKKKLLVAVNQVIQQPEPERKLSIGVALLKNASRFEWMLEKVTEIGVSQIYPLLTERTGREHFRQDRMQQIVVSACLQSRQFYFPLLFAPINFQQLVEQPLPAVRYLAHCMPGEKGLIAGDDKEAILLIGPEGDFTEGELQMATGLGFHPVTLGKTRLRTETAGIVGAVLLRGNS
jgi:16S rRNA (uracil1498-N3)-methyltransferase